MGTMCQYIIIHYIAFLGILMGTSQASIVEHCITSIPNITTNYRVIQYSGHLPVTNGSFFYWFIRSKKEKGNIPIVLWLNGGPGCSSVGSGLFTENGPFLMDLESEEAKVVENPYSWHKIAHMLYLDAPVGTGYSYSTTKRIYSFNETVIPDIYQALTYFFSKYSEYSENDFYIFGQSLAGYFIPLLVDKISTENSGIKLKGFAVGGGYSNNYLFYYAQLEFLTSTHSLGSNYLKDIMDLCCSEGQTRDECAISLAKNNNDLSQICFRVIYTVLYGATDTSRVNYYNRLKNCYYDERGSGSYTRCVLYSRVEEFLDRGDVRKALHAERPDETSYQLCRQPGADTYPVLRYVGPDIDMSKYYRRFIEEKKLDILAFSGDEDLLVPARAGELFTYMVNEGAEPVTVPNDAIEKYWFDNLKDFRANVKYNKTTALYEKLMKDENSNIPWFYRDDLGTQIGGYSISYPENNYTFITVRGAGHAVPRDKPLAALTLFCKFIRGEGFGMNENGTCFNIGEQMISKITSSVSSCRVESYAHILSVILLIVLKVL